MSRDSELVAKLRRGVPYWTPPAPLDISGDRPNVSAADALMSEAADTIDRLTSTGEAAPVAWQYRTKTHTTWRLVTMKDSLDHMRTDPDRYELRPLYTHASPREGHVEVPRGVIALLEKIAAGGYSTHYPPQAWGKEALALIGNQGETKP